MSAPRLSRRFWALIAFFGLMPIVAAIGALAFAPLQAFCGFAALAPRKTALKAAYEEPAVKLVVAFVLFSAASALWGVNRETTQYLRLLAGVGLGFCFVAAATMLTGRERALVRRGSVIAVLVLQLLLLAVVLNTQFLLSTLGGSTPPERLIANPGRGVAYSLFLIWPALVMLIGWGPKGIATAAAALCCIGWLALQFDLAANTAAFALGLVVFLLAWLAPGIVMKATAVLSAASIIAAPWLAVRLPTAESAFASLPWSWAVRLDIWRFTAEQALERPLFGWGIDAARSFTRVKMLRGLPYPIPGQHPHNAALQIWLETGIVGAALFAAALVAAAWALSRKLGDQRGVMAALTASWASYWVIANISHSIWQEWFVTAPFTIAVLAILLLRKDGAPAAQGARM